MTRYVVNQRFTESYEIEAEDVVFGNDFVQFTAVDGTLVLALPKGKVYSVEKLEPKQT